MANNGRSFGSVFTVRCWGQSYPTNTSKVEGYVPDSDTMSSTCSVGNDGQAYWNNGILDCVLGNENSTAFGQT